MGSKARNIALVFLVTVFSLAASPAGRVPPPKTEAELLKLMRLTWDRQILPSGASAATLARLLARGQVVLMDDHPAAGIPWSVAAGIMVDAPPEAVFAVVTDFDHYPGVMPMTSRARAQSAGMPNLYEVTYDIELLFSMIAVQYSVYHYHRPPYRTDWAHSSGEFEVDVGFWQLIPADSGRRTMLFYSVYSRPRHPEVQALYREEPTLELMTNVATAAMVTRAMKAESERRSGKKLPPLRERSTVEEIQRQDPETLSLLAGRGKVMTLEAGPSVYVTSATVVSAPPETCYRVLADFESYPQFLPGVTKSSVKGKGRQGVIVDQETSIKLWKIDLAGTLSREYVLTPNERISWRIERVRGGPAPGFWRITSLAGGKKTLLLHGNTEDLRGLGILARTALDLEPSLEYGVMAAVETATMDCFKKRMEAKAR